MLLKLVTILFYNIFLLSIYIYIYAIIFLYINIEIQKILDKNY